MAYEIFTRKVIRTSTPAVSISKTGRIAFNQAATSKLNDKAVEYCLVMWDKTTLTFAVRPITRKDTRAYKVIYFPKGKSSAVNAKTFFDHIRYDYSETRTFEANWNVDEEMFEVNLPKKHFQTQKELGL